MRAPPLTPTHRVAFERQPRRAGGRRLRAGARPRRAASPTRRTLFHAPSFSAGVIMGAIVVLGFGYLPELMSADPAEAAAGTAAPAAETRPQLTFEFDDLLRNSQVIADPEPYRSDPPPAAAPAPAGIPDTTAAAAPVATAPAVTAATAAAATPAEYLLQAASFRSRNDAERLRAALLLMDLPAATHSISLDSGIWYRVTVGPFDNEATAQRALTRLRENDIAAIWARR